MQYRHDVPPGCAQDHSPALRCWAHWLPRYGTQVPPVHVVATYVLTVLVRSLPACAAGEWRPPVGGGQLGTAPTRGGDEAARVQLVQDPPGRFRLEGRSEIQGASAGPADAPAGKSRYAEQWGLRGAHVERAAPYRAELAAHTVALSHYSGRLEG